MLTPQDLRRIARARLEDAEALLHSGRYDGAVYLGGYAVELAVKARICKHLRWEGFPASNREFENLRSLRTHDLGTLLRFTGLDQKIKRDHLAEWAFVTTWNPEVRYEPIGATTKKSAEEFVGAIKVLLGAIR